MATGVAVSVPASEPEFERSEEEARGHDAEEEHTQQHPGPAPGPQHRLAKLPLSRIKALMKADPDVSLASQESVFIIAKATVSQDYCNITWLAPFYIKH